MAKIKYLVIHSTATPEGRDVSKADIVKWHTGPKSKGGRGWSRVGYSDLINLAGELINLRSWDQDDNISSEELTNGAKGFNSVSRHVVYAGGTDKAYKKAKDTRTPAQGDALLVYVKFMILMHPHIKVLGHNQISTKACPSFDVSAWLHGNCINIDNIYG